MILRQKKYRMGIQTLEKVNGRYFLSIRNRTYYSRHEVPKATAKRWLRVM